MSPLFTYTLGPASISVLGKQPRINDNPSVSYEQALALGARRGKIAQLIVARDAQTPGHKGVYPARFNELMWWDGAIVKVSGAAVIIQTADCPTVIMHDRRSGNVALVHAGRPALRPDGRSCGTVLENALHALSGYTYGDVEALVVGNICGHCFKHDKPGAEEHIAYFRRLPPHVFADEATGALDLYEVIKHGLVHHGVPEENIRHAGPCSLETPQLASYRRDKTILRNTIIVVKKS